MTYRTRLSGDALLTIEFDARIDPAINARAIALADALAAAALPGVLDVLPTYTTVAVHVDPLRVDYDRLIQKIERLSAALVGSAPADRAPVDVPVCYGGELGPDLETVAAFAGATAEEVIALHTARVYHAYMLGFLPGFAYLGVVDPRIAIPRRATPRTLVPPGSVGIAGAQTGVYAFSTPGGWQIIGRSPLTMFDPLREAPSLLTPGDRVRFVPVTLEAFLTWPG
jgi:KipI family sensor histidine kinase inhibitor